ncbi:hypothetical protein CTAYLR_009528 [Chrysophaeum taylorii]|uniref:Uncharacterized protein n=1 Tax=Chrysophaeum taylorii TaxID=2483200 RepID=A0AAD7UJD8_9STRA|nr:hypothetical protein CTAYLR_009528 [Chrysophaeum taylorii]
MGAGKATTEAQKQLLYPVPEVEKVINDSPGLEDPEDPAALDTESLAAAKRVFDAQDEVVPRDRIQAMLGELGLAFDADQWDRLVAKHVDNCSERVSLEEWLDLYARVVARDDSYGSRLRKAAVRGDVEAVRDLIRRGCDPRGCDGLGYTALHYAAMGGHLECVNLEVLRAGTTVDVKDKQGWTPFVCAAANGHLKVMDRLLALGADIGAVTDRGRTGLHWAAAKGRLDCVLALLKRGADVRAIDKAGMTPLHLAAQHGHVAVCTKLISKSEKPLSMKNNMGSTPSDYQDQNTFWVKVHGDTSSSSAAKKRRNNSSTTKG